MRRVVVTGLGVVSPLGNQASEFFDNLLAGRSGIQCLTADFCERLSIRIAASTAFEPTQYFSNAKLRSLDRVSQFALVAASQAIADAGIVFNEAERVRAGVCLGTGMGGASTTEEGYVTIYKEKSDRVKPYTVLSAMNNAAASWIGLDYQLSGPNLTFSTACSSSAVAIGEAWRLIRDGTIDTAIAGGSEAPLTFGTLKAWEAMKTLALEDKDDPSASCKPFAKDRTGLVLAEGAAILVMEEYGHAVQRSAPIYAEMIGYGLCTDIGHITRPSVDGQANAMRLALQSAALKADAIDYINAHGTGTLQNDAVETAAIKQVYGERAYQIPVSSTKSMHGHLLGASGALEIVVSLLAMKNHAIPPTMNLRIPDPNCDLDYVSGEARSDVAVNTVMSNSFAFGGTNAVLIARRGSDGL